MVQFTLKSGHLPRFKIGFKADWNKAKTSSNGEVSVVETNILAMGQFGFATSECMDAWTVSNNDKYLRSLSRIVVIRNKKTSEMHSFIMSVAGEKYYSEGKKFNLWDNTYLKRDKDLSGYVLYHDLSGAFVNGWIYCDGQITNPILLPENLDLPVDLKSAKLMTPIYQWVRECSDWQTSYVADNGDVVVTANKCTETLVVAGYFGSDMNGGVSLSGNSYVPPTGTGGTSGGYDPAPPAPEPEPVPCTCINECIICGKCTDNLVLKSANTNCIPREVCTCPVPEPTIDVSNLQRIYPCAYDVYNSFGNFDNFISSTLQSTFGSSHTFNVTFTGAALSSGTDGDFSGQANGLNSDGTLAGGNFTIRINDYVLNNSTKEYIAVTYAHETLHGLINYYNANDPAKGKELFPIFYEWPSYVSGEHLTIANRYVDQMANVVLQINPNMPTIDAKCLAWNGLQGTRTYILQRSNYDQINGSGAWEAKMAEVNQRERNGTSAIGIKCPPKTP